MIAPKDDPVWTQLGDEVAILKGQKPRPQIRPSILNTPPETTGPSASMSIQKLLKRFGIK